MGTVDDDVFLVAEKNDLEFLDVFEKCPLLGEKRVNLSMSMSISTPRWLDNSKIQPLPHANQCHHIELLVSTYRIEKVLVKLLNHSRK